MKQLSGPLPISTYDEDTDRICKQKVQGEKDYPTLKKKNQVKEKSPIQINKSTSQNEKELSILL